MAVFFLDNNQDVIKIVPDDGAISILQTQELPESDGLLKDTLYVRLKNDERLFDAQYMAVKSYGDNRNAFDLYRIVNEIVPDNATEFEGVQLAPYELEGVVIEDLRPQYRPLDRTMNQLLEDTDWRLGYMDDNLPTVSTNFYYVSVKDALKQLQDLIGVEFLFKVEISGNEITDKWVEVYREVGNRTLKRFNYGTNALTVKRETSSNELYTALIGRGKGEEVSSAEDNPGGQAGYGRKINFEDVEWSKANGDPVDKPKGQKYIELPQATEQYGIKLIDGRKVPRVGIVEFPDTEEPEVLINQTWQELQYYARPRVLFSTTVAKIGDTGIGDTVTIHRHDLNMHYMTRVRKVVRNRKNGKQTQLEIGDVVHTASTKRQGQINSALNNVASDLENVRGEITEARQSADGKNTNFYGNVEPDRKKVGDTWFRDHPSLTGESQILVWNGEAWELIMDTSDTTKVARQVAEQQKEIATAQSTADEAVQSIDTAVANAGFTSLDATISSVQSISNTAQQTASDAWNSAQTAISDAQTALGMATTAVSDVASIDVRVDEAEGTLELKADAQRVDTLAGTVQTHGLDIQANAEELALKANQDVVDTLTGTVSSLGTDIGVVAGKINSKVWNTDIESAIDGIEVGGRNLFLINRFIQNTNIPQRYENNEGVLRVTGIDGSNVATYTTIADLEPGTEYVMTFSEDMNDRFEIRNTENNNVPPEKWEWRGGKKLVFRTNEEGVALVGKFYPVSHEYPREIKVQVEKGNKATDWTPAPEDTLARFDHIETEWTQTFDSFSQTVAGIDGRVTAQRQDIDSISGTVGNIEGDIATMELTISGLQTTVSNKAEQSHVTQLSNLIDARVTTDEMENAISISEQGILAQTVLEGEVVAQINQEAGTTLIENNRIYLAANTVAFSGEAIIPSAAIESLTADKVTTGTLNAANVRIINLDVNSLSGNTSNFVQSNWNSATGGSVRATGGGLLTTASDGSQTYIQNGIVGTRNPVGATIGQIGYVDYGASPYYTITQAYGAHFRIRSKTSTSETYKDSFTIIDSGREGYIQTDTFHFLTTGTVNFGPHSIGGINGQRMLLSGHESVALRARESTIFAVSRTSNGVNSASLAATLDMNDSTIRNIGYVSFSNEGVANSIWRSGGYQRYDAPEGFRWDIANVQTFLMSRSNNTSHASMYAHLNMQGYNITNQSDERIKEHIKDTEINSLEAIKSWRIVGFNFIQGKGPEGRQMGVIAQNTPDLAVYDAQSDTWSINSSKQIMMNSHAIQQLACREENTNLLASENRTLLERQQDKIKELEQRIEELERKVA